MAKKEPRLSGSIRPSEARPGLCPWPPGSRRGWGWGVAGQSLGLELCREKAWPGLDVWRWGGGRVGTGSVAARTPATSFLSPHPHPPLAPGQTYYGQVLRKSADLQTNACVTSARLVPKHIREALKNVHEEVALR